MGSDFATARHHLELAHNCLSGDDELTQKMLAALGLLIDATLTAEYRRWETGSKVVPFAPIATGRLRSQKKPFGNRGERPQS